MTEHEDSNPASFLVGFGRYCDHSLEELEKTDRRYVSWLISEFVTKKHKQPYWLGELPTHHENMLIEGLKVIQERRKKSKRKKND